MSDKIERDRDRVKKTGEIFTPEWLVDEMLMKLYAQDPTLYSNADKTFLEPACGDGNFLVRILHFKILYNQEVADGGELPIERILQSIYGIDIMPDNVKEARRRMLQDVIDKAKITDADRLEACAAILDANIVRGDALNWDFYNWCAKSSKDQIDISTGGTITFDSDDEDADHNAVLAGMSAPKVNTEKPKAEVLGGDFFKF
jgi:hypothetical protein